MASQTTLRVWHEKLSSEKTASTGGIDMGLIKCATKRISCSYIKIEAHLMRISVFYSFCHMHVDK